MQLIIPSAKIVPEDLQNLGKLPALIYPIDKGIVFDSIFNQYMNLVSKISIIGYEEIEKLRQGLSRYKDSRIEIIELDEVKDLGYTILKGMYDVDEELVINFADTIIFDDYKDFYNNDSFFYAEDYPSDVWTFFEEENGEIKNIYDKQEINYSEPMKLFVGVFYIKQVNYFKKCLTNALDTNCVSSFYTALQEYSYKYPLKPLKVEQWHDVGHSIKYSESALAVKARSYNHITIDHNRGILKKTSSEKDKLINEAIWYLKLPVDIEYVRPRIFSYSLSYDNPYIEMEYYDYHTLHELYLYSDLNSNQWKKIFERIRFIYLDLNKYTLSNVDLDKSLEDVYYIKTVDRLNNLKKQKEFKHFYTKEICINGIRYISLNKLISKLKNVVQTTLFNINEFNIIHGDLCFTNIMIDSKFSFIKVIDPRGKFGDFDIYGDSRYELAKLLHSVEGKYDFIIKDFFELNYDENNATINYTILEKRTDSNVVNAFLDVFKEEIKDEISNIRLIEALLFLGMISLHTESIEHQMVMLGTGINLLEQIIDIRA